MSINLTYQHRVMFILCTGPAAIHYVINEPTDLYLAGLPAELLWPGLLESPRRVSLAGRPMLDHTHLIIMLWLRLRTPATRTAWKKEDWP